VVDPVTSRRWLYRALFVAIAGVVLFVRVLPVTVEAGSWPGPDLILALAMAWGFRRPDYAPSVLVGLVVLMGDLILQRPPGLLAGLVVLALEFLRGRLALWRDLPFAAEWALVSALMAAVVLVNWLVLAVFMVDQAAIGLHVIQLGATALAYPAVVLVSTFLLGVRKIAPGEAGLMGQAL